MDFLNDFIVVYFFQLLISVVMVSNAILRYKQHPRISTYSLIIIGASLLLAISHTLENYGKITLNTPLTTFCSFFGYVLNPFCIFFFMMMSGEIKSRKHLILLLIPLIINGLVYILMFLPVTKEWVVPFEPALNNNELVFLGGPLRFTSHIVSALYLVYLVYISITKISSKHLWHGLSISVCAAFVVSAVIIESFFNPNGDIYVLSTTIAFSTIVYYLFLYIERAQVDALTGLFNRETYYHDVSRLEKSITGIIQFDMNGLKYINDNLGHLEGDKALATIAKLISSCAKRNMSVYRLGGDEFLIIAVGAKESELKAVIRDFDAKLKTTSYHCSVGYAYRKNKKTQIIDVFKEAEKRMYEDKADFYKNSSIERRKN